MSENKNFFRASAEDFKKNSGEPSLAVAVAEDGVFSVLRYEKWIEEIAGQYRISQIRAATAVNVGMLKFYWRLGADIKDLEPFQPWGTGFINRVSSDLKRKMPNAKCFSPTNLYYIRSFYKIYSNSEFFPQLGGNLTDVLSDEAIFHIPWGHHKYIIDRFKDDPAQAYFYVQATLRNGWSRAVLINFMDTDLFHRQGRAISNFGLTLPAPESDLAQQITKDPYVFDHLALTETYHEKELKDALLANVENFLLELGQGFALVGREYRLQIGATENFADILFFHVNLNCYVVVEIKVEEFSGENVGQLGLYVSAVNHLLRKPHHAPTIGLLICKSKDNVKAQWTLESVNQPIGISEYKLSAALPASIQSDLPTVAEIESGLRFPEGKWENEECGIRNEE